MDKAVASLLKHGNKLTTGSLLVILMWFIDVQTKTTDEKIEKEKNNILSMVEQKDNAANEKLEEMQKTIQKIDATLEKIDNRIYNLTRRK